ncbi:hypothetical protein CFIO01_05413 [Colletotrichum fioriniae PJ7]|uniref:Uncharacterized protein n=1 Tax=Colletotrichum fioriniae PJ7 TaxID=1445577 RepID=A0A010RR45_9PEZI|nr:hypothetical protein CFIO01_05413 [Colletotrichum fioriniae PJ7]
MPQSSEQSSNTINDMDIDPDNPATYDWVFSAYERVGPETGTLKLSGASFDMSPGYIENPYVGSLSWLVSWFPYNVEHLTIYFAPDTNQIRFSIPKPIIAQNFENFSDFRLERHYWKKIKPRPYLYELSSEDADAFGLIMGFLMTGTFHQHPQTRVRSVSHSIDEFIHAGELSIRLGLRCIVHFIRAVSLHLRQLLLEDWTALLEGHISSLYDFFDFSDERSTRAFRKIREVFAHAMVKP